jgi:hypothetical protein
MQTWGTALQLVGNAIMLGGLVYAWHSLTRFLSRWGETARGRLTRLRDSLASVFKESATGTGMAQPSTYGWSSKLTGVTPGTGTPEERISQLEAKLVEHRVSMIEMLRTAIDGAIADEREESKAVQLYQIYPAVIGLLVSIAGYACQLHG